MKGKNGATTQQPTTAFNTLIVHTHETLKMAFSEKFQKAFFSLWLVHGERKSRSLIGDFGDDRVKSYVTAAINTIHCIGCTARWMYSHINKGSIASFVTPFLKGQDSFNINFMLTELFLKNSYVTKFLIDWSIYYLIDVWIILFKSTDKLLSRQKSRKRENIR